VYLALAAALFAELGYRNVWQKLTVGPARYTKHRCNKGRRLPILRRPTTDPGSPASVR